ncbi:MAG: hypothetical protein H0U44_10620 [Flavisolibacter sp.]|jgi:hypothetical protein|nr:hypothetical protein [Flavisolibacter sp.]
MDPLNRLILALEENIPHHHLVHPDISKASVGWHIAHSFLTMEQVINMISKSNPGQYHPKSGLLKSVILLFGKIPRGKGRAPLSVQPKNEFTVENLQLQADHAKGSILLLDTLSVNHFFDHPYFGNLNLKPTRRFLYVHTNHHVSIVRDIVKKH